MYPPLFFTMGPTNKNIALGLKCLRYGFICVGTHLFLNPQAACYPPPPYFYYRDPQIKILPRVSGVFAKGLFVLEPTSSLTLGERVTPPPPYFYYKNNCLGCLQYGFIHLRPTSSLTLGQRVTVHHILIYQPAACIHTHDPLSKTE